MNEAKLHVLLINDTDKPIEVYMGEELKKQHGEITINEDILRHNSLLPQFELKSNLHNKIVKENEAVMLQVNARPKLLEILDTDPDYIANY